MYIFIGIYLAAIAALIFTIIHVSRRARKRDGYSNRPGH
jgi:MFS superfamily sulfate permease-like transporter